MSSLLPDLGYQASPEQVAERVGWLQSRPEHGLFLAQAEGVAVGWVHVYGVRLIESEGYAEIGGIVVRQTQQQRGIGTQLLGAAEGWALEHGYARVRLRSGVHREGAHRFYEVRGYAKSKASFTFERQLIPAAPR